jgi:small subunit ribosomal protein S6
MNKYEAIFVFRPEEENVARATTTVQTEFGNSGISVTEHADMGLRTLAYKIKKQDKGRYFCYKIEASPDKLKPLGKQLQLKEEILKFVFFRKD